MSCVVNVNKVCGKEVSEYTEGELVDIKNQMVKNTNTIKYKIEQNKQYAAIHKAAIDTLKKDLTSNAEDIRAIKAIIADL